MRGPLVAALFFTITPMLIFFQWVLRKLKPAEDGVSPPASGAGVVTLSKVEQAYCTKNNLTPEQFAAKKAGSVRKAK